MHELIEHAGTLELVIEAPTREGVFEEALAALAELVRVSGDKGEPARHVLVVESAEPDGLLAEWLSELVYLAANEDFVPDHLDELALRPTSLRAVARGRRGHPAPPVESATHEGLELGRQADGTWSARVALVRR